MEELVVTLSV